MNVFNLKMNQIIELDMKISQNKLQFSKTYHNKFKIIFAFKNLELLNKRLKTKK